MAGTFCPVNIPGSPGAAGAAGAAGANGVSAIAVLTAPFTMPAELASAVASVDSSAGFTIGQVVYLQFLGYFEVTAKPLATQVTLKNLEDAATSAYLTNSAPGIIAPVSSQISPAGPQGAAGSAAAAGAPTTAQYILQVPNAGLGSAQALFALASGYLKGTTGTGSVSTQPPPIPIADGGTNATTAAAALTSLGAAPSTPTFITQTPHAGLSAEQALSALASGFMWVTTGTGVVTAIVPPISPALGGTGLTSLAALKTALGVASSFSEAVWREVQPTGTNAGAFASGIWVTRTINTELYDIGGIASAGVNPGEIVLAAGTYVVEAEAPAKLVDSHKICLYDVTAGAIIAYGTSARSEITVCTDGSTTISRLHHTMTIAVPTTYRVDHRCFTTSVLSSAMGEALNLAGVPEIYAWIKFTKIA